MSQENQQVKAGVTPISRSVLGRTFRAVRDGGRAFDDGERFE